MIACPYKGLGYPAGAVKGHLCIYLIDNTHKEIIIGVNKIRRSSACLVSGISQPLSISIFLSLWGKSRFF